MVGRQTAAELAADYDVIVAGRHFDQAVAGSGSNRSWLARKSRFFAYLARHGLAVQLPSIEERRPSG